MRGHHLVCLHFFGGEGYSEGFVENLLRTLVNIKQRGVAVVEGADDICAACPYLDEKVCAFNREAEAEVAGMDRLALELLEVSPGESTGWKAVRTGLPAVFGRWYQENCRACRWLGACEKDGYFIELRGER